METTKVIDVVTKINDYLDKISKDPSSKDIFNDIQKKVTGLPYKLDDIDVKKIFKNINDKYIDKNKSELFSGNQHYLTKIMQNMTLVHDASMDDLYKYVDYYITTGIPGAGGDKDKFNEKFNDETYGKRYMTKNDVRDAKEANEYSGRYNTKVFINELLLPQLTILESLGALVVENATMKEIERKYNEELFVLNAMKLSPYISHFYKIIEDNPNMKELVGLNMM